MAASSRISNQSTRASAILKVVGIYLLTFTLLTLIFHRTCTRSNNVVEYGTKNIFEKYEQAEKDKDGLTTMIGILDSIAILNKERQVLDEKDVAKAEGVGETTKITKVGISQQKLQVLLSDTGGMSLKAQREIAEQIINHLSQSSDKIRTLREELVAQAKDFERKLEVALESANEENDQLSTQLSNQGGTISDNSGELRDLQVEKDRLVGEAAEWTALKEELTGEVEAMRAKIDEQLDGTGLFNNRWKDFTVNLKGDVQTLWIRLKQ